MNYTEQMQTLVDKYREAGQSWPATAKDLAKWAYENELWRPHPSALIAQCAEDFARALREEYITDSQGRRVRAKHVARIEKDGKQIPLWDDIRTASREHGVRLAAEATADRRRLCPVADGCRQLQ